MIGMFTLDSVQHCSWLLRRSRGLFPSFQPSSRVVGKLEVTRFIRRATRLRRFFRCSLAASNFRSGSAALSKGRPISRFD